MVADIITILTCFGPTLQFVVVNVILTLRSHLFITDAKSLRYRQCGICLCPQFSLYVTLIINYLFSTVAILPDVNSPASTIVEYSNAIVHAFQGFRAPFSGKIVHIFPEQSAAFN